jgi:hypothetical protein
MPDFITKYAEHTLANTIGGIASQKRRKLDRGIKLILVILLTF